MDLKKRVVKGLAWSTVQQWGGQLIQAVVFVFLVRFLEPDAFGLVSMAMVFVAFVRIFLDQGLGRAIIQRPDLDDLHLDTAFWISIGLGTLMAAGGVLASGGVSRIFHEPRLAPVVAWLSTSFILYALASTQQALLERELDFRSLAIRSLVSQTGGGIAGILAALGGLGVWSLVIHNLTAGLLGVVTLWTVSPWRPGRRFSMARFRELFGFSVHILGINITGFLNTRADNFLIGIVLGSTALGYYTVAYRLVRVMIQLLSGIVSSVFFPAFSKLQGDLDQLRRTLFRATEYTAIVAFPVFAGLVLLAPELIQVIFGPDWQPSVAVMQVLALSGVVQAVFRFNSSVIVAMGKPSWILALRVVGTIVNVLAFFIAVEYGIFWVAAASTVVNYLVAPYYVILSRRLVGFSVIEYLESYRVATGATVVMIVCLLALRLADLSGLDALTVLSVSILTGAGLYLLTLYLFWPGILRTLRNYGRTLTQGN